MTKRVFYTLFILILLALDYAALDDITTGNEPNLTGEWATVFLSIPILLALVFVLFKTAKNAQIHKK